MTSPEGKVFEASSLKDDSCKEQSSPGPSEMSSTKESSFSQEKKYSEKVQYDNPLKNPVAAESKLTSSDSIPMEEVSPDSKTVGSPENISTGKTPEKKSVSGFRMSFCSSWRKTSDSDEVDASPGRKRSTSSPGTKAMLFSAWRKTTDRPIKSADSSPPEKRSLDSVLTTTPESQPTLSPHERSSGSQDTPPGFSLKSKFFKKSASSEKTVFSPEKRHSYSGSRKSLFRSKKSQDDNDVAKMKESETSFGSKLSSLLSWKKNSDEGSEKSEPSTPESNEHLSIKLTSSADEMSKPGIVTPPSEATIDPRIKTPSKEPEAEAARTASAIRKLRSQTEDTELLHRFFGFNTCHDVIPFSVKVIILDSYLEVEKAFVSLMSNRVQAAPIWDRCKMNFIGMLTITDLIDVLAAYYNQPEVFKEVDLTHLRIIDWRNMTKKEDCFITIHPKKNLYSTIERLVEERVHRLPLYDPITQSVIGLVSHRRILKYFIGYENLALHSKIDLPWTKLFTQSIEQLKIGTYNNIATVALDTPVIETLRIFTERKVSSLPVLTDGNVVVKIFSKSDILALTGDRMYENQNITVGQTLERGDGDCEVVTCFLTDTFQHVLKDMFVAATRRVVVVQPDRSLLGIISTSDVVRYLSLKAVGEVGPLASDVVDAKPKNEGESASSANDDVTAIQASSSPASPAQSPTLEDVIPNPNDSAELELGVRALLVNSATIQEENSENIGETCEIEVFHDSI